MQKHYYLPTSERVPDEQYRNLLKTILEKGKKMMPIHGQAAWRLVGHRMEFDMKNGFPVITERDMSRNWKGAIGELVAFLNGARTLDEFVSFGGPKVAWEGTVTEEKCRIFGLEAGDLGPGSYGPGWTAVPTPYGIPFNQVDNLVNQIRKMPHLRTHVLDPWIPYFTCNANAEFPRKVVTAPCHGWVHVHIFQEDKTFILEHKQRSADAPVGLPFNIIEYAALGLELERILGYEYVFDKYVYYISDAHIYESQLPYVEELLQDEPRTFPTIDLAETSPTDRLQEFRKENFLISDYNPHIRSFSTIPTPL
ncbi:MAG: thyA [Patescibacteria group bacterium]|nr:thyA [Patescibacteria group bacterium]